MRTKRTQSRCLSWFGADTTVAEQYAALLADCKQVTVPFCGGLSIVAYLVETAREIVCSDKHWFAINLYQVLREPKTREMLIEKLSATPFHEEILKAAQAFCKAPAATQATAMDGPDHSDAYYVFLAEKYFITAWMGRGGKGGCSGEFKGDLPVRWTATGGSSPLRFRTAVRSIQDVWGPICERCSFLCCDWAEILAKVKNDPTCGVYCDPPWVSAGDEYTHKFSPQDHVALESKLFRLGDAKIVVRYGDCKFIRHLYQKWHIRTLESRNQANNGVGELCITNFDAG